MLQIDGVSFRGSAAKQLISFSMLDGPLLSVDGDNLCDKRAFDVFSTPEAEGVFAVYGQHDPLFVVYGVATDYCVRCVVDGLLARRYRVAIVTDAVRAVDPAGEADLLTRFAHAGAVLTLADVVCAD